MPTPRRDLLLDTAEQLFYRGGFHATGIDLIQAESGVAKTTLYKHFPSKDALILAVLERSSLRVRQALEAQAQALAGTGVERILALFRDLRGMCEESDFNGCLFNNAAAEFMYSNPPIRALAAEHMQWMLEFLERLLAEEGFETEAALALLPMYEGLLTLGRVQDSHTAIKHCLGAITALLNR
ncbi:TetR/AcrR family transcriptional regulator [Marinobacterium marinum]|uniref:TetR/AcrR family transcriptional regulator n=1 Tax=Marinobacterium marinum TaxID=2756129 RepID=A0A7W2ACP9_9GAMM|nr:TetR/AcrR family transcriptional regulator [Marinobacterium marinum]MBA4502767.1 TetR/AcrR family transcriptional regulator [Marinobacterium marinum]